MLFCFLRHSISRTGLTFKRYSLTRSKAMTWNMNQLIWMKCPWRRLKGVRSQPYMLFAESEKLLRFPPEYLSFYSNSRTSTAYTPICRNSQKRLPTFKSFERISGSRNRNRTVSTHRPIDIQRRGSQPFPDYYLHCDFNQARRTRQRSYTSHPHIPSH